MSAQHVQPVSRYAGSRRNCEAMSAMTRCQSTTGSAAAATKTTGPERRADMRRSWRLAEHLRKGGRDPLDLPVGHPREERQRDRACSHVLADRELALAVAERLAVIRHEVDRGQVRLALHPVMAKRAHDLVAVVAVRDLDDVDEPAPDVPAGIRARQPEALDAGQRLALARGDARAGGEPAG